MPLEWQLLMEGGQERGPLSIADLRRLAEFGQLAPGSLVRPVGGSWQPAGTVAGLFSHPAGGPLSATPAPLAPTPLVPTPLVPTAPLGISPQAQPYPAATYPAAATPVAAAQHALPPLPQPPSEEGLNPAVPAVIMGVVVVGLGGLLVCVMIAMALIRSSLPAPGPEVAAQRKAAPGRTGPPPVPPGSRGIGGRQKEDSDRFRKFAEEAGKTPWVPGENPPPAQADLAEIDRLERTLRTWLAGDTVTPAAREFASLQRDYRVGRITAERYQQALAMLLDRFR